MNNRIDYRKSIFEAEISGNKGGIIMIVVLR
jgi:hypothetical protein